MRHGDEVGTECQLGLGWQVQQAQVVGDSGAVLPYPLAQLLVGEAALLNKGVVREGNLHRVEVLALYVLHQRHLHHLAIGGHTDISGYLFQASHLRGTETPLAGNQLVFPVGHLADGDRGDDPLLADGLRQFLQRSGVKLLARLERVGLYILHGNHADGGCHGRFATIDGIDIQVAQDGVKPAAGGERFLACHYLLLILFRFSISEARLR